MTKAADFYRRRNNANAMSIPFLESEPIFEEGRCLLNGNTLDADNKVIEVKAIIVEENPAISLLQIEEEKGEIAFNNEHNVNDSFYLDPIHHT